MPPDMPPDSRNYRIVLADDHVLIRHGIKNILSQDANLEIIGECGDGEELLAFLRSNEPDMVILDISMPKINGIDLTESIKSRYPGVKVMVLTMHKSKQFFYRAMSAGADGYLIKSDSGEEILQALQKIQSGRSYIATELAEDFTEDMLSVYRDQAASPFKELTKREKQILALVVEGNTSRAMAEKLNLSPRTVDHHRSSLLRKFNMKNSVDLVNYAVRNGYISLD
jgi:DNA-binding NarL/FixJ family response regulator